MTTEEFIEKARKVHGAKYDYSKVEYVNSHTKVCIICQIHGEFWQTPNHHLRGYNCPKCSHQSYPYTTDEFIKKAKAIHGDKYDYSKVEYVNSHTKVCIICPIHGEFWQIPTNHIHKTRPHGCPMCHLERLKESHPLTTEEFVKKAKALHGDKYDYSKVEYVNSQTKVCIICPKHGEFWQTPNAHLRGSGCKICNESHLEREIRTFLDSQHIEYQSNAHFDWLKRQHIDFYLPKYNIGIECQGEQHFVKARKFNKRKGLDYIMAMDAQKYQLSQDNGLKLIYYTSSRINAMAKNKNEIYNNNLYTSTEELLNEIRARS